MSDTTHSELPFRPEVAQALQQWPQNAQASAAAVRGIADRSDSGALNALAAMLTVQAGSNWTEGLPYARRAAEHGYVGILNNYFGNMLSDAAMHAEAATFIQLLAESGWPIDPLAYIPNFVASGNVEVALRLAEIGPYPASASARATWEELLSEMRASVSSVGETANAVAQDRDRVITAIRADENHVRSERTRMEDLVAEVADLANEGAAQHLAKEYEEHAREEDETADRFTKASLAVGAFTVVATCVIAYLAFTQEEGAGAILTKAALALPLIAFTGYIARLAATHRRQAWRWRHMELQISTARPFLAPLAEEQRRALTAALALRFFPGQQAVDSGTDTTTDHPDPVAAIADLIRPSAPQSAPSQREAAPQ